MDKGQTDNQYSKSPVSDPSSFRYLAASDIAMHVVNAYLPFYLVTSDSPIQLDRPFDCLRQIVMYRLDLSIRVQAVRSQFTSNTTLFESSKGYTGV